MSHFLPQSVLAAVITGELHAHSNDVELIGVDSARVSLRSIRDHGVAEFGNGWFSLDVPVPAGRGNAFESLLESGCSLRGAKYCLPHAQHTPVVRAEFPLHDITASTTDELRARTASACESIRAATATAIAAPVAEPLQAADDFSAECQLSRTALIDLLCEANWAPAPAAGERLRVELEVSGRFHQAVIECRSDSIRVAVDVLLEDFAKAPQVCRQAVGVFMFRCSASVRIGSAALCRVADELMPRFQVLLPPVPQPAMFGHAFSALSVMCGVGVGEAEILISNRELASEYLRLQPVAPDPNS